MSRDDDTRSRRPRLGVVAVGLALALVVGCNSTNPTPGASGSASPPPSSSPTGSPGSPPPSASAGGSASPSIPPDLANVYRTINGQVQSIRGLTEKQPVVPTILSRAQMGDLVRGQLTTESPPAQLAAYERLYHALGVLPKGQKLVDVFGDLLESQVGGLYVPTDKKLYVVSKEGGVGPLERFLYSHEYTHALQDQAFDLKAFQAGVTADQTDRQLARQAVFEGDAYTTMTLWLQRYGDPGDMAAILEGANDPAAQAALATIPPLVSSQITFAALQGTVWIFGLESRGGFEAVNEAFKNPPVSSEQVLHPEKWTSREPPIDVKLPADLAARMGSGWTVGLQDTFGEHQLGVWISGAVPLGGLPSPPPEAVVGWGGDRAALLDGPDGRWAVALDTEWDTDRDAAEFETGIKAPLSKAGGPGRVLPGQGGRTRWVLVGSDDATLNSVAAALGLAG